MGLRKLKSRNHFPIKIFIDREITEVLLSK